MSPHLQNLLGKAAIIRYLARQLFARLRGNIDIRPDVWIPSLVKRILLCDDQIRRLKLITESVRRIQKELRAPTPD